MEFYKLKQKPRIALELLKKSPDFLKYFFDYFGIFHQDWIFHVNKFQFYVRPNSVDKWIVTENVVLDSYHLNALKTESFDQIIDIGGNIGAFTIPLSYMFPSAKVVTFEPSNENYLMLKKNIELNKSTNITLYNKAVTMSKEAKIKLYSGADFGSNSTTETSEEFHVVDNYYFRDLLPMITPNTLLKIDIEGGEISLFTQENLDILKAAKLIITEYHFFLETHSKQEFEAFLKNNGFTFVQDDLIYIIRSQ